MNYPIHYFRPVLTLIFFMILITSGQLSLAQSETSSSPIHTTIQEQTNALYDQLVTIRRDLHQYPEVGGEEERTSAFIAEYLDKLGLEVHTNIGGYGVVGILNPNHPGKKIAWRADIDAIKTDHTEDKSYASIHEGVRHICGHDVHTAIALGMANVLNGVKEEIEGTVYFVFQPSEENFLGAKAMITDGLFDLISPDEIYAAHLSPMPAGLVATKPNYLYADYKQLNITFQKNGQQDSIVARTKTLIAELQTVEADSRFWDTRNLMDPQIGIGNQNTIFKDYITVQENIVTDETNETFTLRAIVSASSEQLISTIPDQLKEQIGSSAYGEQLVDISFGSRHLIYSNDRGNINNDAVLTYQALDAISGVYGPSGALPLYGVIPDGRGDDFAYFQQEVPGVYFFIGGSNFEQGIISMPHAPNFAVDESAIRNGVSYFSSMIVEQLNRNQ